MAYPTPPGERIAYDLDGSIGVVKASTRDGNKSTYVMAESALTALNSDKSKGFFIDRSIWEFVGYSSGLFAPETTTRPWITVLFPTPMRLRGIFTAIHLGGYGSSFGSPTTITSPVVVVVETSQDTTNGEDGTWTSIIEMRGPSGGVTNYPEPGWVDPVDINGETVVGGTDSNGTSSQLYVRVNEWFRQDGTVSTYGWKPVAGTFTRNVRAIRLHVLNFPDGSLWNSTDYPFSNLGGSLAYLHLYGEPDDDSTDNRLEFVTDDGMAIKDFDWDDVEQGEFLTTTFRLRNVSTLTANTINLSFSPSVPDTVPSPSAAMEFSLNGIDFSPALAIPSIGSLADSVLIYVRFTVPGSGILGNQAPRILAEVGSWS